MSELQHLMERLNERLAHYDNELHSYVSDTLSDTPPECSDDEALLLECRQALAAMEPVASEDLTGTDLEFTNGDHFGNYRKMLLGTAYNYEQFSFDYGWPTPEVGVRVGGILREFVRDFDKAVKQHTASTAAAAHGPSASEAEEAARALRAQGVAVTEAMVERGAFAVFAAEMKRYYHTTRIKREEWNRIDEAERNKYRERARIVLTAALDASRD